MATSVPVPPARRSGFIVPVVVWAVVMAIVMAMLWSVLAPPPMAQAPTGGVQTVQDGLTEVIDAWTDRLPGAGSGGYRTPSAEEAAALATAFRTIEEGDLPGAAAIAGPLGYVVTRLQDTTTGRRFVVLSEPLDGSRGPTRGWGLFVLSPSAPSGTIVEVPHPVADRATEDLGTALFLAVHARALLIAGAHRDAGAGGAADVAHRRDSVFEAIHRAASASGGPVVQIHGFDAETHRSSGDAVVSSGTATPGADVRQLAEALEMGGLRVCVYDGRRCAGLGGTTNVQGASARDANVGFIHLELGADVRADDAASDRVVQAIMRAIR